MIELVVTLISFVVFAFIIYSSYSARNAKYAQKLKAFELKEAHMQKSMDMVKAEINALKIEIRNTREKLSDFSKAE